MRKIITKTIKLNNEIIKSINNNNCKTVDLITYLLTKKGITAPIKNINTVAIKDLTIDGMKVLKAQFDTWEDTMIFDLKEIEPFKIVENIEVISACNISNYKLNDNKTICLTKDNRVIMTNDYNDIGMVNSGIIISNNESIFYLLTSSYSIEAINYLFTIEDIKEYEQLKRIFNIVINKSEDIEYINYVKNYIELNK